MLYYHQREKHKQQVTSVKLKLTFDLAEYEPLENMVLTVQDKGFQALENIENQ